MPTRSSERRSDATRPARPRSVATRSGERRSDVTRPAAGVAVARAATRRSATDPRIQARRVSVARQLGKRRRRRMVTGLLVVAVAGTAFLVLHSSLFGARHITVSGAPQVPTSLVIHAAGLSGHPPLIDLDAAAIARKVERLPWVEAAAVDIAWPSSVSIRLTQRVPVATIHLPGGSYAVSDDTGRVLEDTATRPASLPVIAASDVGPPGSTIGASGRELAAVAAAMPESLVPRTVELASSGEGVLLVLSDGIDAVIGSPDELSQKFVSLATVLQRASLSGVKTVDLRVAAAPVLIR